jgi:hypothetical protein
MVTGMFTEDIDAGLLGQNGNTAKDDKLKNTVLNSNFPAMEKVG